jgi:glycosyltransferase involved in cell wall biosynthesis
MTEKKQKLTITLTRYAEPNWLLAETLASLAIQQNVIATILMLDQQDNPEIVVLCKTLTNESITFDYHTIEAKSLSFARNEAIRLCQTDVLLYIDTDAIAAANWAEQLAQTLTQSGVGIAGGKIVPKWHKSPSFIQKSRVVLDQYSMLDLGEDNIEVPKVVGASFGLNKKHLGDVAIFDENLGRRDGKLYSGEESKLCSDALKAGFKIMYVGSSVVQHQVLPERVKISWIATRMFYQGIASAKRGGAPAPSNKGKYTIWDFIALGLLAPFYLSGYLTGKRQS